MYIGEKVMYEEKVYFLVGMEQGEGYYLKSINGTVILVDPYLVKHIPVLEAETKLVYTMTNLTNSN